MKLCAEIILDKDREIERLRDKIEGLEMVKTSQTNESLGAISCKNYDSNQTNSMIESLKTTSSENISNNSANVANDESKTTSTDLTSYIAFSKDFDAEQLSELRSIGVIKSKDATFVMAALKCL